MVISVSSHGFVGLEDDWRPRLEFNVLKCEKPAIILPRMGNSDLLVLGFLVFVVLERAYERRFNDQAIRGERKVTWIYWALDKMLMAIYALTGIEYWLRHPALNGPLTATALVFFLVALVLRNTAIRALGKFWSLHVEIRKEHVLIKEGIYSRIRHPAYTAIMIEMISIPLVANSYFTAALSLCVYVPLLLTRWRREEVEMIHKFGDQYVQYCKAVPAFLPGCGCRTSQETGPSTSLKK
jgi:protein-S-isoprenylcysteine O-methyltransferase Ste14